MILVWYLLFDEKTFSEKSWWIHHRPDHCDSAENEEIHSEEALSEQSVEADCHHIKLMLVLFWFELVAC